MSTEPEQQHMAATQKRMLADDMEREAKQLRAEAAEIERRMVMSRRVPPRTRCDADQ